MSAFDPKRTLLNATASDNVAPMGTQFDYLVHNSWAQCSLEIDGARVEWVSTRMSDDAFGELIKALAALLGGSDAETSTVFVDAPGCLALSLAPQAGGKAQVKATVYEDWPIRGQAPGRVILDQVVRLRTLAGAVLSSAQAVLKTEGHDGYLAKLGTPFPSGAIASLQAALKRQETAR